MVFTYDSMIVDLVITLLLHANIVKVCRVYSTGQKKRRNSTANHC